MRGTPLLPFWMGSVMPRPQGISRCGEVFTPAEKTCEPYCRPSCLSACPGW